MPAPASSSAPSACGGVGRGAFRLATAMAALGLTGVVVAMGFAGPDGVLLASVAFLALALALTVLARRS